eukprot:TRINITY_DN1925_c0_g1_i1.p1 TRINITY_DN1925_c0_g1~~TRINITY_DN1925_c0_g1_i1.p1  ORF type:complete len:273 (-),score=59.30 TRINITY_DN1925_c0_g1_i1:54-872(-)
MDISRNLDDARDAFKDNDSIKSKVAHQQLIVAPEKHKRAAGEILESIVFGGLDGIVTTYAIIVAAAASEVTISYLCIVAACNLFADALGMAISDYFSSKAEDGAEKSERKKERKRMRSEKNVMDVDLKEKFMIRGYSKETAERMVLTLSKYEDLYVEFVGTEITGFMPEDDESASPLKEGLVTFISFIGIGVIPLLAYIFSGKYSQKAGLDYIFGISVILFAITLLVLGAVKGRISKSNWVASAFITFFSGAITTVTSYFVGYGFSKIPGTS